MKKIIFLIAASLCLMWGCAEDTLEPEVSSDISISAETLDFGPEGGVKSITVTSSGAWRISGNADWVEPQALEGASGDELVFKAEVNESGKQREAEFKIFSGSAVAVLTVISVPEYELALADGEETEFNITSAGGTVSVLVNTNISDMECVYTEGGETWMEYAGSSYFFGPTRLEFLVAPNETYFERATQVSVGAEGKTITITVEQEPTYAVLTEQERIEGDLSERDIVLSIRHNVELDDLELPEWITLTGTETSEADAEGLKTTEYSLHLSEAIATRFATLSICSNSREMLQVVVRQQNPDAIFAEISDPGLRNELGELGWILVEEGNTKCEVLEEGLKATSLSVESSYWSSSFSNVDGLGAFPSLTDISLSYFALECLDLSDCSKISSLTLTEISSLSEVYLGNNPLTTFHVDNYSYFQNESLSISGENIENIDLNSDNYMMDYYEYLSVLDVSECPKLSSLKVKREYETYDYETWETIMATRLKTVYVSAAQKSAIDAGTLVVEKCESTQIAVKEE